MDSDAREWIIGCSYFRVVGAIERAGGLDGDGSRWMAIWVYLRVEDMVMMVMVMVMGADGGSPAAFPAQSALDKPIATERTATFFCGHIVRIVYSFQHHVDVRADPEARGGVAVCQEGRQDFPHLEGHSRRFHRRRGCSYPGKAWFDEFAAPRSDWRTCVA
jgi:hypothetical protein